MRILVVEDDKTIASFISKGLREGGFAVDHASDGEAGLDLALSLPPQSSATRRSLAPFLAEL